MKDKLKLLKMFKQLIILIIFMLLLFLTYACSPISQDSNTNINTIVNKENEKDKNSIENIDKSEEVIHDEEKTAFGVLIDNFFEDAGYFNDGVCPVLEDGRWGLIDEEGTFILEPQWDYMSLGSLDNYLMVGKDTNEFYGEGIDAIPIIECGFIDTQGNTIVPMKKSPLSPSAIGYHVSADYLGNDKFSIYVLDEGEQFFNKNGEIIPEAELEYKRNNEYVIMENSGDDAYITLYGVNDKDGKTIIPTEYHSIFSIGNGYFMANKGGESAVTWMHGGKWMVLNSKGEHIIDIPEQESFSHSHLTYFDQDILLYGECESFTVHTPVGAVIIGAVKESEKKKQELLEKYLFNLEIAFDSIHASSTLATQGNNSYDAKNVLDKSTDTAWVEGVSGYGEGEWIKLENKQKFMVESIAISNGYNKSEETYYNNSRVKRMRIDFSDGYHHIVELDDYPYYDNIIKLPRRVKTSYVKFTIESVYPGDKYDDTCITKIECYDRDSISVERENKEDNTHDKSYDQTNKDKNENRNHDWKSAYYNLLKEYEDNEQNYQAFEGHSTIYTNFRLFTLKSDDSPILIIDKNDDRQTHYDCYKYENGNVVKIEFNNSRVNEFFIKRNNKTGDILLGINASSRYDYTSYVLDKNKEFKILEQYEYDYEEDDLVEVDGGKADIEKMGFGDEEWIETLFDLPGTESYPLTEEGFRDSGLLEN